MAVHDGHRQRMLSRFLNHGMDTMHSHEILEILLYYAIPRRDTNPIAHALLENFGSLRAVFDAPYEELLKVEGIGPAAATLIKMIPQMARAYIDHSGETYIVNSRESAAEYLLPKFVGRTKETAFMLCLDSKNKVVACVQVAEGNVNFARITSRNIVEAAVKHNAAAIVLAHNHPNGIAVPSAEDIETTKRIVRLCRELGMPMLDHIIVADNDYVSMAETGYLVHY